jgi:hypothetical protein
MGSWSFRGKAANLAVTSFAALLLGAAPTGGVFVTTLPAGADVWVDGTYLGRSPIVLDALGTGPHRLTLTRTGWTSQDVPVTVVPATTITASVILVREGKQPDAGGWIAIHGGRVGGITLDGEPVVVGKDGMFAAGAGTHDVTMLLPAGKVTRSVTVYPQTRTDVALLDDAQTRSVVIAPADDYVPADAVRVDGAEITIHTAHHDVVAHLGSVSYTVDRRALAFDAAPTVIKNRVYLPIELLTLLAASDPK